MISIVIPVYNEENMIAKAIEQVLAVMNNAQYQYEIIIVNDGSTDNSAKIIKDLKKTEIKYLEHAHNKGYGASLKTGIKTAKYDIIGITDADGTYPVEKFPQLIEQLVKHDYSMVIGARSSRSANFSILRKTAKWILKKIAEYLAEEEIPDINSGLRVFYKKLFTEFKHIIPNGFSFTSTITLASLKNDYRIKYMPIEYHKRIGKSKIHPINDPINFFNLIVRTVMYYNPMKVFVPLSFSMFALSIFVLFYSYFFLDKVMDITTIICFTTGLQLLAIGLLADLIDKKK